MISVGIVEDDKQIRTAIQSFLDQQRDMVCQLSVGSVEDLLLQIPNNQPHVLLMDIGLPGMSGIDGIQLIKGKYAEIDIIVFTVYNDSKKIFRDSNYKPAK